MHLREHELVLDVVLDERWNEIEPGFEQRHGGSHVRRVPLVAE